MSLSPPASFTNAYADERRAASYAALGFPGTYYLAFRDLPEILGAQGSMGAASGAGARTPVRPRGLDFGCGAGRSSRFLKDCGFEVTGVDISPQMIDEARRLEPGGDYRLIADADLSALGEARFDVILSAFTFDNVPGSEKKIAISRQMAARLSPAGRIVHIVSSPDIYLNEWASFSTRDFPENRRARPGDVVRTIITETDDPRPVDDVLCPDEEYRRVFRASALHVAAVHRPLGREDEPCRWVSETRIAPWVIYVLTRT